MRSAEEVAQLLGNKGSVALLELELLRPGQSRHSRLQPSYVEAFRNAAQKHGTDNGRARTKAIPGGLNRRLVIGRRVFLGTICAGLVEGSPPVDAVVTFAGLPDLSGEELRQYQTSHPPLVVEMLLPSPQRLALSEFVDEKTVALAVVPFDAAEAQAHANEPKIFEHYYRILRPASK